jgi:pimeloyl-ACP methyl ester carboxylesterase
MTNNRDIEEPDGFGSVSGVPGLPVGFSEQFTSRLVDLGGLRLHAVLGGSGPPLILIGGWPQFWWQWRHVMPPLARQFSVVAVDPRGFGLSDKPEDGYDTATLAADVHRLAHRLGYAQYNLVGHDVGMWIAYAMAADAPAKIRRLVLVDAVLPGVSPTARVMPEGLRQVETQYHFMFNRLSEVNEQLVEGREEVFFGHQFAVKGSTPTALPASSVEVYLQALRRPGALHAASSATERSRRLSRRTANEHEANCRCPC